MVDKPGKQFYDIAETSPYPQGTVLMAVGPDGTTAQPLLIYKSEVKNDKTVISPWIPGIRKEWPYVGGPSQKAFTLVDGNPDIVDVFIPYKVANPEAMQIYDPHRVRIRHFWPGYEKHDFKPATLQDKALASVIPPGRVACVQLAKNGGFRVYLYDEEASHTSPVKYTGIGVDGNCFDYEVHTRLPEDWKLSDENQEVCYVGKSPPNRDTGTAWIGDNLRAVRDWTREDLPAINTLLDKLEAYGLENNYINVATAVATAREAIRQRRQRRETWLLTHHRARTASTNKPDVDMQLNKLDRAVAVDIAKKWIQAAFADV